MPRAIWSGAISFGLVNVPVKLYSAVSKKSVRFHQIDAQSGARIKQRRVSAETGEEVPFEQIVKGYELGGGSYVTVDDAELGALEPEAQRTIDIDEFVDLADIDPVFYDNAYYLAPEQASAKPYALLVRAMAESDRVAVAHFVMRSKQYLAAVRARDGLLVLSTMVYADEINDPATIPELDHVDDIDVSDRELAMAEQLIESLSAEFEPGKYHDRYREAVLELIERKASGEEVVAAPSAPAPERVVDLMAALEASVKEAKEARRRHPTSQEERGEDGARPTKRAKPKKKSAARKSA